MAIKYSDDNVKKVNSINSIPDLSLDLQKSRRAHLVMYKDGRLAVLSITRGAKNPKISKWQQHSVEELWKKQSNDLMSGNLGLRLDSFAVIDIDNPKLAADKLREIQIPDTEGLLICFRGNRSPKKIAKFEEKGHIYFKKPDWLTRTKKLPDVGIEIRTGSSSQNVIPDSQHPDGSYYKWHNAQWFDKLDQLPELPRELYDQIISKTAASQLDVALPTGETILAKEEATKEFHRRKVVLDSVLIDRYNFRIEEDAEFSSGGIVVSKGINYSGYCPRSDRHSTPGNSNEFIIHLSYSGNIRKHCHHTHCSDIYKEKLTDLFDFFIDTSGLDSISIGSSEASSGSEDDKETLMGLRQNIYDIRNGRAKEVEKEEQCFSHIVNYLEDNGVFLQDENQTTYYFHNTYKSTMVLDRESKDYINFLHCIGIPHTHKLADHMTSRLQSHCRLQGKKVNIKRFCYYDQKNFTLYLDLRNEKNEVLKITPDCITIEDNGVDGIMFLKSGGTPIEIELPLNINTNCFQELILDRINFDLSDSLLNLEEQQLLLDLYIHSMFFENIFPTKLLLLLLGIKGSGKSYILRLIGKLLFGKDWNLSSITDENERDIKVAASHKTFLGIDNADTYIKWLNDFLAKIATGESFEYRKLHTTNDFVQIRPQCFIGLTARTPKFRRDDIADRLLILKVKPLQSEYIAESVLLKQLEEYRHILWSEIINKLQMILGKLKKNDGIIYSGSFRMADFYSFTCKICGEESMKMILKKMQQEQFDYSLEEDPLYEFLSLFVDGLDTTTEDDFLTGRELYESLRAIAENNRMKFPYKSTMSLAAKIKHCWSGLQSKFDCEFIKGKFSKYRFKRKA